jgi:hypothetical protein
VRHHCRFTHLARLLAVLDRSPTAPRTHSERDGLRCVIYETCAINHPA